MNINMLISKLNKKNKGQWFKAVWVSDVPVKAAYKRKGIIVNKMSYGTVRYGINYSNMKSVIQKTATGQIERTHELPWGKWMEGYEGILIEHTNKKGEKNIYLRVYTSPNKTLVSYFLNGSPITKEKLKSLGYVSESVWNKNPDDVDCFTLNVTNITDIY